jgi:hypothetical protein
MDLTPEGFDMLLARLDANRDEAGRKYVELLRKLARFLGYWGCSAPPDQADDALARTAAKIQAGEPIENLQRYTLGVAHLVYKESVRDEMNQRDAMKETVRGEARPRRRRTACALLWSMLASIAFGRPGSHHQVLSGAESAQPREIGPPNGYIVEFVACERVSHPPEAKPLPGGMPGKACGAVINADFPH